MIPFLDFSNLNITVKFVNKLELFLKYVECKLRSVHSLRMPTYFSQIACLVFSAKERFPFMYITKKLYPTPNIFHQKYNQIQTFQYSL